MSITIPLGDTPSTSNSLPSFSRVVVLEGVSYTLSFQWNTDDRSSGGDGFWYMTVLDETGTVHYRTGIKLTIGWFQGFYTSDRTPPGFFLLDDTSGADEEAGLLDLGGRCQLTYFTADEIAALDAA